MVIGAVLLPTLIGYRARRRRASYSSGGGRGCLQGGRSELAGRSAAPRYCRAAAVQEAHSWARALVYGKSAIWIVPAAARSWSSMALPTSAICAVRTGPRSLMCAIPGTAGRSPASACRPATHSHKVRVANGIMLVNHEINGADPRPLPADFKQRDGHLRRCRSSQAAPHHAAGPPSARAYTASISTAATPTCRRRMAGYVGTIVLIMDLKDPARAAGRRPLVDAGTMDGRR